MLYESVKGITDINTSTYRLGGKSIQAGSSGSWTVNAPEGATKILALILNSIGPSGWGTSVRAVNAGVTMNSATSAELSLRAYVTDTFNPQITLVWI